MPHEVLAPHMEAVDVVEQPVVRLADDRQRPVPPRPLSSAPSTETATKASRTTPDTVCVRDRDRRRQLARFANPFETSHLAVAVEPDGSPHRPARPGGRRRPRGTTTVLPWSDSGPCPTTSGPSPSDDRRVPHPDARHSVIALRGPGPAHARWRCRGLASHRTDASAPAFAVRPVAGRHRSIVATRAASAVSSAGDPAADLRPARTLRLRRLPGRSPQLSAHGRRRGVPRPARPGPARSVPAGAQRSLEYLTADPVALVGRRQTARPFANAPRRAGPVNAIGAAPTCRRRRRSSVGSSATSATTSVPSSSLGRRIAADDQDLPLLRLGLYDWVVAWDRRTGQAWLGGRALDGDAAARPPPRDVRARLDEPRRAGRRPRDRAPTSPLAMRSNLERAATRPGRTDPRRTSPGRALPGQPHPPARDAVRRRSLAALPPAADRRPVAVRGLPRPGRRAVRPARPARDPVRVARAVPLGRRAGLVTTDPIKGTRPRGRDRADDRALACELLGSAKDRAENVMIVDVLRNDLGRVAGPAASRAAAVPAGADGGRPAPRIAVTGSLAPGRDPFDLLVACFPGRLDHGRAEDPGDGDPRGARARPPRPLYRRAGLDRARRRDGHQHPDPDLRRGRPAAQPARRGRDHLAERRGRRVGRDRRQGARPAGRDRRGRGR